MIDLHLINTALAAMGISAGAAVVIAAAIIAIAAIRLRGSAQRRDRLAGTPGGTAVSGGRAAADREPALR